MKGNVCMCVQGWASGRLPAPRVTTQAQLRVGTAQRQCAEPPPLFKLPGASREFSTIVGARLSCQHRTHAFCL